MNAIYTSISEYPNFVMQKAGVLAPDRRLVSDAVARADRHLMSEVAMRLEQMSPPDRAAALSGWGVVDEQGSAADRIFGIIREMDPGSQRIALQMLRNQMDGRPRTFGITPGTETERFFIQSAEAMEAVQKWAAGSEIAMSRPQGSAWHKLRGAHDDFRIVNVDTRRPHSNPLVDFFSAAPHVILVEHDWRAAFSGTPDFDEGAFRLPYPSCCFEFVLNERRVCAIAREVEGGISMRPFVQYGDLWVAGLQYDLRDEQWETSGHSLIKHEEWLAVFLSGQIRAIAILLETEAFVANSVAPPEKLNKARLKRGELPLSAHHVISLSPERIARKQAQGCGDDPKWKVRCHFRRGHWRRYATHKTWVKWMLVGDPNLGFVEKEYRI